MRLKGSLSLVACCAVATTAATARAQFEQPPAQQASQTQSAQPTEVQQPASAPGRATVGETAPVDDVVARVNGEPITQRELQLAVQSRLQTDQAGQGGQIPREMAAEVEQQVLDSLVESRLVEQHMVEKGPEVAEQEVQQVIQHYEGQLKAQGVPLDQYLAQRGMSKDAFARRVHGSLGWHKFQQQALTEENLQAYFQQNQQQFGTDDFDRVRQQVASTYVAQLWRQVVEESSMDARIEKVMPAAAPTDPDSVFGGQ